MDSVAYEIGHVLDFKPATPTTASEWLKHLPHKALYEQAITRIAAKASNLRYLSQFTYGNW